MAKKSKMKKSHFQYKNELIDKALEVLDEVESEIASVRGSDRVAVRTSFNALQTRRSLMEMKKKKRVDKSTLGYLEEASRRNYYDVLVHYNIATTSDKATGLVLKPEKRDMTRKDLKKLFRKQKRNPDEISRSEQKIIGNWSKATRYYNELVNKSDDEIAIPAKSPSKVRNYRDRQHDVSVGGSYQIITDISAYSGETEYGYKMLTKIQAVMNKSRTVADEISAAYNRDEDGIKTDLRIAKGSDWYEQFALGFLATFIKICYKINDMDIKENNVPVKIDESFLSELEDAVATAETNIYLRK